MKILSSFCPKLIIHFCVLVAENFITSCPDHPIFRKKTLDVRLLEKTAKVKAEDLPSNLNPDYILLYFEKFGEIEGDVETLEDRQSAIITFQVHTGEIFY